MLVKVTKKLDSILLFWLELNMKVKVHETGLLEMANSLMHHSMLFSVKIV
ncbi:hypothetical protein HanPSC8_Chr08g0312231 [Helianthus annuus]|nr:hypothetical protein HanIR_Chr08g0347821 [Helianthus annuus]KAJ0900294.1 hypothetical protein HanPSC8_Chr08g0312231 [Helianthus annuus]